MIQSRVAVILGELEAAAGDRGGDPTKQVQALQRLVQAANASPQDVWAHLTDVLRVTYFQTGVRALRVLSYSLLLQCRDAWSDSSSEWDNVVGSVQKDLESPEMDLQTAALKAVCVITVPKMVSHLERNRINLTGAVGSAHGTVRRQAVATMGCLLLQKFSSALLETFGPNWMAALVRLLWTDADPSVVQAAATVLRSVPVGGLRAAAVAEMLRDGGRGFRLTAERVRVLMSDGGSAAMLAIPLAWAAVSSSGEDARWLASTVLLPRLADATVANLSTEVAQALLYLSEEMYGEKADRVLLESDPSLIGRWNRLYPIDLAVAAAKAAFPENLVLQIRNLSLCLEAHLVSAPQSVSTIVTSYASDNVVMAALQLASIRAKLPGVNVPVSDSIDNPAMVASYIARFGQENVLPVARKVRISPDSSPVLAECHYELDTRQVKVKLSLRNSSGIKMTAIRVMLHSSFGAMFQPVVSELNPQQAVDVHAKFPVSRADTGLQIMTQLILLPGGPVVSSSSSLVGRSFYCRPVLVSFTGLWRPLKISPAEFSTLWNAFGLCHTERLYLEALDEGFFAFPVFHAAFRSVLPAVARLQLCAFSPDGSIVLLLLQATKEKNWNVKMTFKASHVQPLLELQHGGGSKFLTQMHDMEKNF